MLVYKTDDRVGRIIFCDIHSLWIDSIRPVRIQCLLKNLLHGALFQTKFAVFGVPVKIIDPLIESVATLLECIAGRQIFLCDRKHLDLGFEGKQFVFYIVTEDLRGCVRSTDLFG